MPEAIRTQSSQLVALLPEAIQTSWQRRWSGLRMPTAGTIYVGVTEGGGTDRGCLS